LRGSGLILPAEPKESGHEKSVEGVINTNAVSELKECGIHSIIIPSVFPTGDTCCYLAESEDGWSVIEAGVHTPPAREQWAASLKEIGISLGQIKKIYITHIHPDHAGIAGWLQQKSDAEILVPRGDLAPWAKYNLSEADHLEQLRRDMLPHGISDEVVQQLVKDITQINHLFEPYPEVIPMDPGETFRFGDDSYQVLAIPGHSDGHVMFLGEQHKRLFSGDSFLASHVSQISDWPYSWLEDPLSVNLEMLRQIVEMNPELVLPAHGPGFRGATERLTAVEAQHRRRMNKVLDKLQGEMTLIEVCQAINVKARVLQEFRVSWADTRAYLECLWRQGLIDKDIDEMIRYRRKAAD